MRFATVATLLLAGTLTTFAPAVTFPLVYEDARDTQITLSANRLIDQLQTQPLRSVTTLTRLWEIGAFGLQPWGFHLGSVIWHLLNVWIVLAVAWLTLPSWAALTAAGVFALHPLQAEAVVYVSARADLVSTCFVLLAVLAASVGSMAGAVVGVVVASLAKESAIVAWALVPLWAAWTSAPFPVGRWCAAAVVGALAGAWFVWQQIGGLSAVFSPVLIGEQLAAVWRLIAAIAVPWGLTVDHDWAAIAWLRGPAVAASIGLTYWACRHGWASRSWLAFAWLWTLVCLSPRFVVPLYEGLHERHFYPVMIGWCLCAGHWWAKYAQRKQVMYG